MQETRGRWCDLGLRVVVWCAAGWRAGCGWLGTRDGWRDVWDLCAPCGQGEPDVQQLWRSEMLARVAFTVPTIVTPVVFQLQAAKRLLVTPFIRLEQTGLLLDPSRWQGQAMDIGSTHPHAPEPRPCCPDVVVHLPAWSQAVALVGTADGHDHLPLDHVTKIGQRVERCERGCPVTVAAGEVRGKPVDLLQARLEARRVALALCVPCTIGGRSHQAHLRLRLQGQPVAGPTNAP